MHLGLASTFLNNLAFSVASADCVRKSSSGQRYSEGKHQACGGEPPAYQRPPLHEVEAVLTARDNQCAG